MTAAIGYEFQGLRGTRWTVRDVFREFRMIRWTLTIFLALAIFSAMLPWLEKLGIGKLPGDVRFTLFGKTIFLPFASTILLSLLALVVARLLR
jgi:Protein of unknown function (DUF2905)